MKGVHGDFMESMEGVHEDFMESMQGVHGDFMESGDGSKSLVRMRPLADNVSPKTLKVRKMHFFARITFFAKETFAKNCYAQGACYSGQRP